MSRAMFRRLLIAGARAGGNPVMPRITASRLTRVAMPGLLVLMLAACSAGPMGGASDNAVGPSGAAAQGNTDLATQQACRQRVNEMYEVRDRGEIYAANPTVNSPFSANYQPDVPSRGLSNQFEYGQSLAECEHSTANGAEGPVFPPSPAPAPAPAGR
jgi:hypothetical protein